MLRRRSGWASRLNTEASVRKKPSIENSQVILLSAGRNSETMPDTSSEPIGGEGKSVESDETYVGGKKKNVHNGKPEPKKRPVVALVERDGQIRAQHVPDVTAKNLREVLAKHVVKFADVNRMAARLYREKRLLFPDWEKSRRVPQPEYRVRQP